MSRLHRYARMGRYSDVAECLAQGDDLNAFSVRHFSPLMVAAREGHTDIVRLLLKAGADANAAHPNGRTALHFAAGNGHLDLVTALVSHGANVEAASKAGNTAVLEAARFSHADVAAFLTKHGADVSRRDSDGKTAADWLAAGGVAGQFKTLFPERFPDPSAPRLPPLARPRTEADVRSHMAEGLSADEYAAKHGRLILVWSYGHYRYRDPNVQTWAARVAEVLFTAGLLDVCEERYLTGDELKSARKCRRRRERRKARGLRPEINERPE
jgi:uncharacterized protein